MHKEIRKFSHTKGESYRGRHRFEHWYVDNQVYFITARIKNRLPAFASEEAKAVFFDRFEHYANEAGFVPWVTTLLDNHYHTLGYLREGENLKRMMQRLHGSVAKLVNDIWSACPASAGQVRERVKPFWEDRVGHDYFDGCIRDEKQCRRAYRYTLTQAVRHGITRDWRTYPHTHVRIELDRGVKRAHELQAFLEGVLYKRYMRDGRGEHSGATRLSG